jgi:hypothetical protein
VWGSLLRGISPDLMQSFASLSDTTTSRIRPIAFWRRITRPTGRSGRNPCKILHANFPESPFHASHLKEQRFHIVVRLLAEVLVVVVMALGWWGMMTLGSYTVVSESDPLRAVGDPIYVAGCPVADTLETSSAGGALARAVLRRAPLTRSPRDSREWD